MPTNLSKTPQEIDHENLTALACRLTVSLWGYNLDEIDSLVSSFD